MSEFVAIDVETANWDVSSICQIGVAHFRDSVLVDEWMTYVNPEAHFFRKNIEIHGICAETVKDAPSIPQIAEKLQSLICDRITVCHTFFDKIALSEAFAKYGLSCPTCKWLDSAWVARRTWKQFSRTGFGLASICSHIGHDFKHHDALEDAKAAGQVILAATKLTGVELEHWLAKHPKPRRRRGAYAEPVRRHGNPQGKHYGQVLVFTGMLSTPRRKAADRVAEFGFQVDSEVSDRTTLLVVGGRHFGRVPDAPKSSKLRMAEELIALGQPIRVIGESDLAELLEASLSPELL